MWEQILEEKKSVEEKIENYKKECFSKLEFKVGDRVCYKGIKCRIVRADFDLEKGSYYFRVRKPRLSFSTNLSNFEKWGDEERVDDHSLLKKVREVHYESIMDDLEYRMKKTDSIKERERLKRKIEKLYKVCTHYIKEANGFIRFEDEDTCPHCGVVVHYKDGPSYPYL